jgi:hypothetical protein
MEVNDADAHDALTVWSELVDVVLEFGTKLMEVANVAVDAHDDVPNVDPVCGPFKKEADKELLANDAEVAVFGTKFIAPATEEYDADNELLAQEDEIDDPPEPPFKA